MGPILKIIGCRDCGMQVIRIAGDAGKQLILEAQPTPDGTVVLVHRRRRSMARTLNGEALEEATQPLYRPHDCPNRPDWRI